MKGLGIKVIIRNEFVYVNISNNFLTMFYLDVLLCSALICTLCNVFFWSGFIVSAGLIALVCWVCFAWEFLCGYCLFSWCWLRVLSCCGQQLLCCDSNCVAVFLLWHHLVQQLFCGSGTCWGGFFWVFGSEAGVCV